jgi:hypothetical protein
VKEHPLRRTKQTERLRKIVKASQLGSNPLQTTKNYKNGKKWVFVYIYIHSPPFEKKVMFFEIIDKDLVYGSDKPLIQISKGVWGGCVNLSINGHRV